MCVIKRGLEINILKPAVLQAFIIFIRKISSTFGNEFLAPTTVPRRNIRYLKAR